MRERAIVVGASGISGGALIAELIEAGTEVWATARYRSRGGHWEKYLDSAHLVHADVLDLRSLWGILTEANPSQIYYLAAIVSVPFSSQVPLVTYQTNVMGWVNMLEAVRMWNGTARILWSGSGDQYGWSANEHRPLREEAPFLPATAYAASKCAQDLIAYQYFRQWKLPILRTRTFYLAGPGQVESYACASFAHQVARVEAGEQDVIKHGNLDAERDYLDIRDVARAYRLLAEKGIPGEAYNVCSGRVIRMSDALETLRLKARCPIATESDPSRMRPSEVPCVLGSPEKLKAATGWAPKYSMDETLAEMLEYARQAVRSSRI